MGNRELNKEIYRNTSLLKIKAKIQGQIGLVILYSIGTPRCNIASLSRFFPGY
jgi:hypothetical protein